MTWRHLCLALAALAFPVAFHGVTIGDWPVAVSAAVVGLFASLEWIGVPVLGRWWRENEERQEPPSKRRQDAPGKRHVGPFWKATRKDKANKPAPPGRSKLSKRPKNSRPRPKREPKW